MRVYYGWYIVAISMLVLTLAMGTTVNAFGVFVLPVSREFGLSRADTNTGYILLNFGGAIASVYIGRLLDIFPVRLIMAVSAIVYTLSFIALGLSHNIVTSSCLLAIPLAAAMVGAGNLTSPTLVARWFNVYRGRAMAIAVIGMSLGIFITAPVMALCVDAVGWRKALIGSGVGVGAMLLLLAAFVRERPGADDIETQDARRMAEAKAQARSVVASGSLKPFELLRTPQFWMISFSAAVAFGILQSTVVSLIPIARGEGIPMTQAAMLLSIIGGTAIFGKVVLAWISDRVNRIATLALLFGLMTVANGAVSLGDDFRLLIVCSAGIGLAAGASMPAFFAVLADRFGPVSFGTASGLAMFIVSVVSAIMVRFSGEVFDRTGSYNLMFSTFVVLGTISVVLMLGVGRLVRAALQESATS